MIKLTEEQYLIKTREILSRSPNVTKTHLVIHCNIPIKLLTKWISEDLIDLRLTTKKLNPISKHLKSLFNK